MARVAVVMDRFLKYVGLTGKSIIPMVIGVGCGIPGVMATRTIKNQRQRRTTAMLAPFMPCGAKLPVIALFAGAFFADQSWVGTSMYFLGIAVIIIGALIIQRITGERKAKSFFIMEMPEYKAPSIGRATISMLSRAKAFIIKATTIILICNAAVQIMQMFDWSFMIAEETGNASILETIASPFAFLLIPLGFGVWQFAAAAITGFIAKENVVGTVAVVFGITNFIDTDALEIIGESGAPEGIAGAFQSALGLESTALAILPVIALSYLVFNLFTPPCFACIGAQNAEMESKKWLWGGIAFQFGMGYVLSFLVYQIGSLVVLGTVGSGFIPGLIAVAAMIIILIVLMKRGTSRERAMLGAVAAKG